MLKRVMVATRVMGDMPGDEQGLRSVRLLQPLLFKEVRQQYKNHTNFDINIHYGSNSERNQQNYYIENA